MNNQLTEEQINETLTALLFPLIKNCMVDVAHKMHTQVHGTAWVCLMFDAGFASYQTTVETRFTVVGGAVLLSDREKFVNDAINQLGREVFKA